MRSRSSLLFKLLTTILDEWDISEVQTALDKILHTRRFDGTIDSASSFRPKKTPRLTAILQVQKADIQDERRQQLLALAEKFDRKEFLPSIADVREFILMTGKRPVSMKDRTEAFRVLLNVLTGLPLDRLQNIAIAASQSGPAQLGPISDAISAAGERLQRRPHEDDKT